MYFSKLRSSIVSRKERGGCHPSNVVDDDDLPRIALSIISESSPLTLPPISSASLGLSPLPVPPRRVMVFVVTILVEGDVRRGVLDASAVLLSSSSSSSS